MIKKQKRRILLSLLLFGLVTGYQTKVESIETEIQNITVIEETTQQSTTEESTTKVSTTEVKQTSTTTELTTKETATIKETSQVSDKTNKVSNETSQTLVEQTQVTTQVKKSLEEIVADVLNGKYGNSEERYTKLKAEGYNYDEVQAEINKRYTPARQASSNAQQSQAQVQQQSSTNIIDQMPVNSLYINGYIFPIIEAGSQYAIDNAGQRIVNWNGDQTGPKYVGGASRYFALHNIPYGQAVYNASQVILKDYNGNVKTYNLQWVSNVIADGTPSDEYQTMYIGGTGPDVVVIQTCIDAAANYRYWVFS